MTNNDADQLYDMPMVAYSYTEYTDLWEVYRCFGMYRSMVVYRCMGSTYILGHMEVWECTNVWGHTDLGCMDAWECMDLVGHTDVWGSYKHPPYIDIPPHACQLLLKEYVRSFPFPSC